MAARTTPLKAYKDDWNNIIECASEQPEVTVEFRGKNNTLKIAQDAKLQNSKITFLLNRATCVIGQRTSFSAVISLGEDTYISIGEKTTVTSRVYIESFEGAKIIIGRDCMFSTGNVIRAGDAHPIYDVLTEKRVNKSRDIIIGDHVWLAYHAVVLAGARIGSGSIIGFGSIVKAKIPNNVVAVGSKIRIIKQNIAWERPHLNLNPTLNSPGSKIICPEYWNNTVMYEETAFVKLLLAIYANILRLFAKDKYYRMFKSDHRNFFEKTKHPANLLFLRFLNKFGPL